MSDFHAQVLELLSAQLKNKFQTVPAYRVIAKHPNSYETVAVEPNRSKTNAILAMEVLDSMTLEERLKWYGHDMKVTHRIDVVSEFVN